jgi:hypothetical protein
LRRPAPPSRQRRLERENARLEAPVGELVLEEFKRRGGRGEGIVGDFNTHADSVPGVVGICDTTADLRCDPTPDAKASSRSRRSTRVASSAARSRVVPIMAG